MFVAADVLVAVREQCPLEVIPVTVTLSEVADVVVREAAKTGILAGCKVAESSSATLLTYECTTEPVSSIGADQDMLCPEVIVVPCVSKINCTWFVVPAVQPAGEKVNVLETRPDAGGVR